MSCATRSTVTPCLWQMLRMRSETACWLVRSRLSSGSSSISIRAPVTSAWAIRIRCCSPPDSPPLGRFAQAVAPTHSTHPPTVCRSERARRGTPHRAAAMPRPSPVTDEVRRLFEIRERHAWAIEELHETVRSSLGSADYSSVFRAVSLLEKQGLIDRIDLGEGHARFELREDHHEHIRCDSCGRVAEVPVCVLDDAAVQVQTPTGYRGPSHPGVLRG